VNRIALVYCRGDRQNREANKEFKECIQSESEPKVWRLGKHSLDKPGHVFPRWAIRLRRRRRFGGGVLISEVGKDRQAARSAGGLRDSRYIYDGFWVQNDVIISLIMNGFGTALKRLLFSECKLIILGQNS
jgi:hypothetical protein